MEVWEGVMRRIHQTLASLLATIVFGSFVATAAFAQAPPLISPEVHSDNRVTFRFRAPNVKEVNLFLEGVPKRLPMQKDDQNM